VVAARRPGRQDDCVIDNRGATVQILAEMPDSLNARQALRAYFTEIVERYQGRPTNDTEIDQVLLDESSDELRPPTGAFWVATLGGQIVGCAGLRYDSYIDPAGAEAAHPTLGEVTRVYVSSAARRQGLGSKLLDTVERHARERGISRLRLDVRGDLVEARALYARRGYREVPRFNDSPYADHWFMKDLG
jgi:ribosomal protein S18 acetylase RimI-like enzyme